MTTTETLGWYWHRLLAMEPAELTGRVAQTARRWTEPSASRRLAAFRIGTPDSRYPQLPCRLEAPQQLREAVSQEAASIREGRWLLFGWKDTDVHCPPVWHRDYLHGADAPTEVRHLNHRDLPGGAEARCIWETNRWAEMVRLAQNAWLNGALDDALLAQSWLFDWCEKNPLGKGINWCSPLEAGLRLVNFCWLDALVRACGNAGLTMVQDQLAQQIVPSHAWWVWRHRSFGSSANNHLLGELAGLVLVARRWPSLTHLTCSAERAWELLFSEIFRQFAEDGGNREQALHYHQFAWELAWQAERVMTGGRGASAERLRKAARFFCDLYHDCEPWDFGDSDDAQVTPFGRGRRTAASEWKAWLLGRDEGSALRFWLGEPPSNVPPLRPGEWREYPLTGLAVQEVNRWKARIDGSPLGFGTMAAHGHLDAMHLSLWDGDHALVVDPGTGAYFGDPVTRTKLASWELHNGPLPLSGRTRPHRTGPFIWADHHRPPKLAHEGASCSVRFAGESATVVRAVRYLAEADAWRVTDEISGDEPHVVRWRLAPDWTAVPESAAGVRLVHTRKGEIQLTVKSDGLLGCELSEDLVSPHFGDLQRGAVVTVAFRKRLSTQWQRVEAAGSR